MAEKIKQSDIRRAAREQGVTPPDIRQALRYARNTAKAGGIIDIDPTTDGGKMEIRAMKVAKRDTTLPPGDALDGK